MNIVYIAISGSGIKIGATRGDPAIREGNLDREYPDRAPIRIVRTFPTGPNLFSIEKAAHDFLMDKRQAREWFSASVDEAAEAIGKSIDMFSQSIGNAGVASTNMLSDVVDIERRVKKLWLPMSFVLKRARISPSCWSHWRNGKRAPLQKNWVDFVDQVEYLERVLG